MKKLLFVIILLLTGQIFNLSHAYTIVSQGLNVSSYTASSFYNGWTPDLAFDGNWDNMWNAGKDPGLDYYDGASGRWVYAYPWIEVDLGAQREITKIVLGIEQLPPGYTEHIIRTSLSYMGDDLSVAACASILAGTYRGDELFTLLEGNTIDGQRLVLSFALPVTARYVQVKSLYSRSWIAWNEIQIMTDDVEIPVYPDALPAPEPGTALLVGAGALTIWFYGFKGRKTRR